MGERSGRRALRGSRALILGLVALIPLLLAACGTSTPKPPQPLGGSYTNAEFHFSLTYPSGWQINEFSSPAPTAGTAAGTPSAARTSGAPIPLTVVVTRSGSTQANSPLVSNLTVAILDLRNPKAVNADLLKTVMSRSTNSAYHAVPLAGHTAYATQPQQQTIYGTPKVETHTDYYLLTKSFEYHLSTDALAGDQADDALKEMLASLTLTS